MRSIIVVTMSDETKEVHEFELESVARLAFMVLCLKYIDKACTITMTYDNAKSYEFISY